MEYVSKIYMMVILHAAVNRVFSSKSLRLLIGNKNTATSIIKKGIKNKHIKEAVITQKKNGVKKTETYYMITKKGYEYLIEKRADVWGGKISSSDFKQLSVLKNGERNAECIWRELCDSTIYVLAEKAGVKISRETIFKEAQKDKEAKEDAVEEIHEEEIVGFVEDDYAEGYDGEDKYDGAKTVKDLLAERTGQDSWNKLALYAGGSDVEAVLHNARDMKENAKATGATHDAIDFARSRIRAVIDSEEKTLAVYVAPKFGMRWDPFNTKPERGLLRMWTVSQSIMDSEANASNGLCAAVIVENPTEFETMLKSKYIKSKRGEDYSDFANIYDHMFVIPNDENGIEQLSWLMSTNTEEEINEIRESAVSSGLFRKNKNPSKRQFALADKEGNEVAIGVALDIKDIITINRVARNSEGESFYIICYDWQVQYFKNVLPESVAYYVV